MRQNFNNVSNAQKTDFWVHDREIFSEKSHGKLWKLFEPLLAVELFKSYFGFFLPSLKDSFRLLMLRRKKSFLVQQEQGLFLCLRPRRWVSNAQGVFLFGRLHFLKGKKEKHKHYNASSYSIDDCWSSLVLYLLTCLFVSLWYFNFPKEQYCNVTHGKKGRSRVTVFENYLKCRIWEILAFFVNFCFETCLVALKYCARVE